MNGSVEGRIVRILARTLRLDAGAIRPESTLVGDLGARSIDIIETILELEEEFQTELPECDITPDPFDLAPSMTVRELAELVGRHVPASGS